MRARRLRPLAVGAVVSLTLTAAGCADDSGTTQDPESTDSATSSGSPTSETPEPAESARLYTRKAPSEGIEGNEKTAAAAVRTFAQDISSGDRKNIDKALHAATPEDPTVIDQTLRAFEDVTWDEGSLRWTEEAGVLGPCYLLLGEGKTGPVHLAGTVAWNDARSEWEFTTPGFPGSSEYPELPSC